MAENPLREESNHRYLDASGPREVVYCHQCYIDWYQDEHGLTCPRCESEITEIVTPESDPRPGGHESDPELPPLIHDDLNSHNPWPDDDVSDPEEADIEEHIRHGSNGAIFVTQTFRSGPRGGSRRRHQMPQNDPENIMRDFHSMMRSLMGPNIRMGEPGRSGPDALFPPNPFGEDGLHGSTFRLGSNGTGPHIVGGRVTYRTTGRLRPRNVDGPQLGGPPVDDLATLIGTILGQMGPLPGHPEDGPQDGEQDGRRNMPRGLQGLFASLLNPANAVHGDAVYSQEALDRIISTLMEQHPTSNAPGPASPSAIAALPKKKLDEKMLGPELKGECSVCMDDVHVGDEVVALPCTHWFHEACASAWLSEHNTCPICRKGIDTDTPSSNSRRSSGSGSTSRNEHRNRRMSMPRRPSRQDTASRNEARLDSIRDRGRLTPPHEAHPTRWQGVGERPRRASSLSPPEMPSGFINSYRRRDSELSENQRDSRRGHTSSSDNSRSSPSGNGGGSSSGNGPISWLRDRFSGSNGRRHD